MNPNEGGDGERERWRLLERKGGLGPRLTETDRHHRGQSDTLVFAENQKTEKNEREEDRRKKEEKEKKRD